MRGHEPHHRVQGPVKVLAWAALPALTLVRRKRAVGPAARRETLLAHDGPESRDEAFAELGCLPPSEGDGAVAPAEAEVPPTRMTA